MKTKMKKSLKSGSKNITQTSSIFKKRSVSNSLDTENKSVNTDSLNFYDISKNSFDDRGYSNNTTSFTTTNKHKNINKSQYNVQDKNDFVGSRNKSYHTFSDKFDKAENMADVKFNSKNSKRQFKYHKESQPVNENNKEKLEDSQNSEYRQDTNKNTFEKRENQTEDKVSGAMPYKKNKRGRHIKGFRKIAKLNEEIKAEKANKNFSKAKKQNLSRKYFDNKQKSFNKEKDFSNSDVPNNSDKEFFKQPKSTEDLSSAKKVFRSENIKKKRCKLKSFNEAKEVKFKKNPDKAYRRKNYNESGYTRDKLKKDDEFTDKETKKSEFKSETKDRKKKISFQREEKKKEKLQKKKDKLEKNLKKTKDNKNSKGAVYVTSAVNSYVETGKDDNAGVGAAHKVTDTVDTVVRKRYFARKNKAIKKKKKLAKVNKKIEKIEKKIFFKTNMEELKKTKEYQNTSRLKQFLKRREYKKKMAKKYKEKMNKTFSQKVKKFFSQGAKGFIEYIKARNKKLILFFFAVLIAIFAVIYVGTTVASIIKGMLNSTVSSTYLSDETVLSDCNNDFSIGEQGIIDEMDSVEENHPGYDEYIIKGKEKIGHDTHELLAYITAKYGVVNDISEVKGEIDSLIEKMYKIDYREEIEIRYRTVYYTYTDEDGNTQTDSYEESYEYKKLYATLTKKNLDDIVREEFKDYPNNLSHYETLVASKGNMELVFGNGSGNLSEIVDNPNFGNPGIEFDDESVKAIVSEAEKHIGKRYVFGANGPSNFDCSSFVCWTYTHSGIKNMPRTTAWGIYKSYCNPISPSDAKAGDIIFFKGTYNSGSPISHVGIYVGNGYMIHAGDPIKYARIDTPYWKQHFYSFGRPK